MCGVIAVFKKVDDGIPTAPVVLDYFKKQITRGQQGFGYVAFDDTVRAYIRRQNKEEIEKALSLKSARSIMFHHRIPTSTPNFSDTTHPIKVSHKELLFDYYVIHNGIISNDSILHDDHVAMGYVYNTTVITEIKTSNDRFKSEEYNDSEAFAIDLVRTIEGKQDTMLAKGSIAFIALQVDKKTQEVKRSFFGHNAGNPLSYHFTDNVLVLRSMGEEDEALENTLISLDFKTWEITENDFKIGEYATVKNYYNNNMGTRGNALDDYGYEVDDGCYGKKDLKSHELSEIEIIDSEIDRQSNRLDELIENFLENEQQLIGDIAFYETAGSTEEATECRIQLSKNRETITRLENEQAELMDGEVLTK